MSADPIHRLAKLRIIKASADLEVQLSSKAGSAPAIEIVRRLKERAAESMAALVFINFLDPSEIPKAVVLQNEIKRYDEWFDEMRKVIAEGVQYDKEFTDDEREEMLDILTDTPEGQQQAIELGLVDDPSKIDS